MVGDAPSSTGETVTFSSAISELDSTDREGLTVLHLA